MRSAAGVRPSEVRFGALCWRIRQVLTGTGELPHVLQHSNALLAAPANLRDRARLEQACRQIMACTVACKGDMGCEYLCGTEAVSPANVALTSCMQVNNCLPTVNDTKTPDDFTNRTDSLKTVAFKKEDVYGQWWINFGLNVPLDCVPCQSFSFSPDAQNASLYAVHQRFRSFKTRIWNYVNYSALYNAEDAARGRLNDRYSQAGFGGADVWYILGLEADEMVAVYTAHSNWLTHGVFVMSRAR